MIGDILSVCAELGIYMRSENLIGKDWRTLKAEILLKMVHCYNWISAPHLNAVIAEKQVSSLHVRPSYRRADFSATTGQWDAYWITSTFAVAWRIGTAVFWVVCTPGKLFGKQFNLKRHVEICQWQLPEHCRGVLWRCGEQKPQMYAQESYYVLLICSHCCSEKVICQGSFCIQQHWATYLLKLQVMGCPVLVGSSLFSSDKRLLLNFSRINVIQYSFN